MDELTPRDRELLDFEHGWWTRAGNKEQRIWQALGISPTDYYKQLNTVIDSKAALGEFPLLVKRLRRLRFERRRAQIEANGWG
jgi:hypothetical protein